MGIKIIKEKEGKLRRISDSYSVLNLLTANESDKISLAIGTADSHSETTKTTSERIYYVLEGELIINGITAKRGDVIFIPANTQYSFKGSFKSILINSPPFRGANESVSQQNL